MFKNSRSASLLSTAAESDRSQARAEKPGSLTQPRGCHRIRIALAAFLLLVIRLLLLCGLSLPTHAQVAGGTLSGKITDPSGAAIALAEVEIKNVATGVSSKVSTNDNGFYSATNLLSGEYRVTVSAKGFNTAVEKTGINLTVGAHQTFDLTLQIGTRTDIVEVMTEPLAVQLSSSDISDTVNATTVRELPLNGRSWTDLATLQPGVNAIQTQPTFAAGADRGNRGYGQQLTISGARPQQNNYRLDGVSLNDYANGAPGSVLGGTLGVDAIQEFSVITTNYSAEYGKTSGGVINAVTRSGSNAFHGSAYEFVRNSALDARNFFDGNTIPPFQRNQFGGAVGGPIFKNRTFFFADYEGILQSKGITALTLVPSLDARQGMIHDVNGNPITVPIDPGAQQYLAFYHLPNGPAHGNGDAAEYRFAGNQDVSENFFTTRLDHHFSNTDSAFGMYLFDKTPFTSPDGVNDVLLGSKTSRQIVSLEETHLFSSSFVNSARFGYNYEIANANQGLSALVPAASDVTLGVFPGQTAAQVYINGLTPFLGGVGAEPSYKYHWNSFQVYDDASIVKGSHTIQFGGAVERMHLKINALADPNGIFRFGNLQAFYANTPRLFISGIASTESPRNLRQTLVGLYLQDTWRWKPNLTLNLGLRYEMTTVPTETDGKLSTLRNLDDAIPHLGDPFFSNPTLRNFEPRIGFAWDPFRNGKMAMRGGVGLYDVLPLPYQFLLLTTQAAPFFEVSAIPNPDPGIFFNNVPNPLPATSFGATFVDPKPKRNYVVQYNLNLQYQITPNLTSMIAYVGSRGLHQPFRVDDANIVRPTLSSAGYLFPKVDVLGNVFSSECNQIDPEGADPEGCAPPSRINENYGFIHSIFDEGQSYYNALELQMVKRLSHGFQVQGSFTWSKSIDTSSATLAGDAFGNSIASPQFFFKPGLSRGLSDFSVGRTLVLNGIWQIPTSKSLSGPARWLADGWQLGMIFTAHDGVPFTPTFGTGDDPTGSLSSDDFAFPSRLGGPGCSSLVNPGNVNAYIKTECFTVPLAPSQAFFDANCDPAPPTVGQALAPGDLRCFNLRGNAGRNILIGPGTAELDFSVFKNIRFQKISENFNVQFRAEIFNVLNHANFAPPTLPDSTDIFASDGSTAGGFLDKTTTTAREIQFGVKIIF